MVEAQATIERVRALLGEVVWLTIYAVGSDDDRDNILATAYGRLGGPDPKVKIRPGLGLGEVFRVMGDVDGTAVPLVLLHVSPDTRIVPVLDHSVFLDTGSVRISLLANELDAASAEVESGVEAAC